MKKPLNRIRIDAPKFQAFLRSNLNLLLRSTQIYHLKDIIGFHSPPFEGINNAAIFDMC